MNCSVQLIGFAKPAETITSRRMPAGAGAIASGAASEPATSHPAIRKFTLRPIMIISSTDDAPDNATKRCRFATQPLYSGRAWA